MHALADALVGAHGTLVDHFCAGVPALLELCLLLCRGANDGLEFFTLCGQIFLTDSNKVRLEQVSRGIDAPCRSYRVESGNITAE